MALERGVYNQVIVSTDMPLSAKQEIVAERVSATNAVFDETVRKLSACAGSRTASSPRPRSGSSRALQEALAPAVDQAALGGEIDRNAASKLLLRIT